MNALHNEEAYGVVVTLDGKPELLCSTIRSRQSGAEVELDGLRKRAKRQKNHWFHKATDARVVPVQVAWAS